MTPAEQIQKWLEGDYLPDHDTFSGGREFWAAVLDEVAGRAAVPLHESRGDWARRADTAEADADRLAASLRTLLNGPTCSALRLHDEAVEARG